jgi:hypothetical protein
MISPANNMLASVSILLNVIIIFLVTKKWDV